jgi:hypothetical protein
MFNIDPPLTNAFVIVFLRLSQFTFLGFLNRGGRVDSTDTAVLVCVKYSELPRRKALNNPCVTH